MNMFPTDLGQHLNQYNTPGSNVGGLSASGNTPNINTLINTPATPLVPSTPLTPMLHTPGLMMPMHGGMGVPSTPLSNPTPTLNTPGLGLGGNMPPSTPAGPGSISQLPNTSVSMNTLTPMTPTSTQLVDRTKHPSGIVPQLQNIVSTVNLGTRLDLKQIALQARNAEYNPKRFAAVIMRIREPKTTALIFASGKMVCTGAKSEEDSKMAARRYARIIQKLGFPAKFLEFRIQNIVGSCDVKFPIRLEGLANDHGRFSSYEPELFPGLIYRMVQPKIVLLIFVSGKIVLTGAKVRDEIYDAFNTIYPILLDYKKEQ